MKKYGAVVGVLLLFFLVVFLLVEQLHLPLLTDPQRLMSVSSLGTALAGVGLLVADIILPVPSSMIMIANGALFGIMAGTGLSLLGNLGAALAGFFIGRRGGPLLARLVSPEERARADRLLTEWGVLAIIITRPIPLLAETMVIIAGASAIKWKSMLLATVAGSLPVALLYALTGATLANFESVIWSFLVVMLLTGIFWIAGRRFLRGAIANN